MAEDEDPADNDGKADSEEAGEEGSPRGKRKLIVIVAAALLLVIGGLAAAYFTGLLDPLIGLFASEKKAEDQPVQQTVFYDMPELLVNLNAAGRRATFLKMKVSLELAKPEDIQRVEQMMPRVVDNFQVYLREVRIEDLNGSAGIYRLREELLARVAVAVAPAEVRDVLFKEMLVQ
jgi:flagellar FliL protein